jgi:flagellar hook assembly protein FlgD
LPEEAKVKIEIYNLLGQKVAALVDGIEIAGNHSVTWNARNFSSGIYFYKIIAEGKKTFEKTQKLVLIR